MAHVAGLVAAGVYPNPVPHAHVVTSTTHKTLRGPRGGIIVAKADAELEKKLQSIVFPGIQGGPLMHVIAAKAVAFKEALEPGIQGLPAAGREERAGDGEDDHRARLQDRLRRHAEPPDARRHDRQAASPARMRKPRSGEAHITVNKNAVPNDPQKPFVTSGLRLGTPAVTTRGYREADCVALANWICDVLDAPDDDASSPRVRDNVTTQCRQFPVYG